MDKKQQLLLNSVRQLHADTLYRDPSITWIYDIDENKLYSDEYPRTHHHLSYEISQDGLDRNELMESGKYVLGRVGLIDYDLNKNLVYTDKDEMREFGHEQIPAVAFWNNTDKADHIVKLLEREHPNYFNGEVFVFGNLGVGVPPHFYKGRSTGSGPTTSESDPRCGQIGNITIQGKPTNLGQILGQLHMVRGQDLNYLKGGFCSQYAGLRNDSEKNNCDRQIRMLDQIASGLQCGANDYQSFLQTGKSVYRQGLRDIFRNPERIGQEFRTQKEIDAAWDYLNKKENFSFREWFNQISKQNPDLK